MAVECKRTHSTIWSYLYSANNIGIKVRCRTDKILDIVGMVRSHRDKLIEIKGKISIERNMNFIT